MKTVKFHYLTLLLFISSYTCYGQCDIIVIPSVSQVHCGDTVSFEAFVQLGGTTTFNDQTLPNGWVATPTVDFSNPCAVSPDGMTYAWMGVNVPAPRALTTSFYDLSQIGQICFDLKYPPQAGTEPCEGPDTPDEGVYLQYSLDSGATWVVFDYYDPMGGLADTNWTTKCANLPSAAMIDGVQLRWYQEFATSYEFDQWGLDNISIINNGAGYTFNWSPNNLAGQSVEMPVPGDAPINVVATNGTETCSTDVSLNVLPVELVISMSPDTMICPDSCVSLAGEAHVVVVEGGTPSFTGTGNFFPASQVEIDFDVNGINADTIEANTISSICISGNFTGNFNTCAAQLRCPDGTEVLLFDTGDVSGTMISSLCFSPDATIPISGSSPPYSGTYLPSSGSFSDFLGCQTNGTWSVEVASLSLTSLGYVLATITFYSEERTREVSYSWVPVTGLDDPQSPTPIACPDDDITYHLVVSDPLGCVSGSDSTRVTINPNCPVSVIELEEGAKVYLPTAFTPNGDGLNDTFYPLGMGLDEYELYVYDRYNELIYTSKSGSGQWDGKNIRSDKEVLQGVYLWRLKVKDKTLGWREFDGKVTLLK